MQEKGGSIVNVASVTGMVGCYNAAAYTAAKAAVIGLTKSMATDYAKAGIRVNCVSPSITDTPMIEGIPEDVRARILDEHLLKRLGRPEDIANAILFLASDKASWITGVNLPVDGELTAR